MPKRDENIASQALFDLILGNKPARPSVDCSSWQLKHTVRKIPHGLRITTEATAGPMSAGGLRSLFKLDP